MAGKLWKKPSWMPLRPSNKRSRMAAYHPGKRLRRQGPAGESLFSVTFGMAYPFSSTDSGNVTATPPELTALTLTSMQKMI